MLDWLYRALGSMLSFFESFTGSYAIALLFYALVFKIVFLPFSIKQQKNQIAMAKLTPKIELIKAKYKGRTDQPTMQKQQEEIMELQKKEGYSPLSGCLPLLIQLPLIMLLYTVIQSPLSYMAKPIERIELYNTAISEGAELSDDLKYLGDLYDGKEADMKDIILAIYKDGGINREYDPEKNNGKELSEVTEITKGVEISIINIINKFVDDPDNYWATTAQFDSPEKRAEYIESFGLDLDTMPNFYVFGVNLAESPSLKNFSILCIIPVLAAVSSWLSMWLTRKMNGSANQSQDKQTQMSMKMMDLVMPLMSLFIAFSFSAMLGLYWVYQSGLGLLQSFILSRVMPMPKFTEEEIKAIHKAQKEAEKEQKNAAKGQAKHRSLHYIDDDDYDVLPDAPQNEDNKGAKNTLNGEAPEIKD